MQITSSNLFNAAHKIARETRNAFANYREAFAAALRNLWNEIKNAAEKAAEKAAEAAKNAARKAEIMAKPRVIKAARHIRETLLQRGCGEKVWKDLEWYLIGAVITFQEREAAKELAMMKV